MKLGYLQITKKTKAGDCSHCNRALELGKPHITVSIKIRPGRGKTKSRFINWHLHATCLALWVLTQMVARQDRRKAAGRPTGTGMGLSPEDKKRRLALCKKRMRLFQEVSKCRLKDERLGEFFTQFESLTQELEKVGGPASVNSRTTLDVQDIERKLQFGKAWRSSNAG